MRLNEAFGDTVNWDAIPQIAIARMEVWSSNPVFGLNALGGFESFATLRIPGVLQRIALCYLAASLLFPRTMDNARLPA